MKNSKRILKLVAVLTVAVVMVLSLASCAMGGTSSANDANGEHGSLKWEYKKDDKTLTVTGSGAMESFKGTDDIAWSAVATSAEKVVIGSGITTVGDYAFFGMTALKEVRFDAQVTKIGKLAFAFTSSLESINIPASVVSVDYGAFEASGIKTVSLPSVTAIADRTFIYCDDLVSVVAPKAQSVGAEAFAMCRALSSVKLAEGASANIGKDAFKDAKINTVDVADGKVTVTYKFVDAADGTTEISAAIKESKDANSTYEYSAPAIKGYEAVALTVTVRTEATDKEVLVTYNKLAVEPDTTEPESETETTPVGGGEADKLEPMTVIALVLTVVIIIGIIVGTIIFIRNDKKNAGKNGTVRKNKDDKNKKKK